MPEVVAALDCGSNSTRLLIASERGSLRREMRITRLSAGVDASGALAPDALERTWSVLREYRRFMDEAGVRRGLLVATSAVRDAANGDVFLAGAAAATGVDARLVSGVEEATLSFDGATFDLEEDPRPTLVLDIGGGSTELALRHDNVLHAYSMQLGCVRVTERALGSGVVDAEHEARTRTMINDQLDAALAGEPIFASLGALRLVGLAGTVATLAQLDQGLTTYERDRVHHYHLALARVRYWRETLARLSPPERLALPGMVPGREDVLHAGLYILEAVMTRLRVEELVTSENDILDGVVRSLLTHSTAPHGT